MLALSNFDFTDHACDDNVPFSFIITNQGTQAAEDVGVRVRPGGYAEYTTNAGTIAAGSNSVVQGTFRARDTCGVTDSVPVIITVTTSTGRGFEYTTAVSI